MQYLYFVDIRFPKRRAFRACTKKTFALETARHEDGAIYEVNLRSPNGWRIAGAAKQRSNP